MPGIEKEKKLALTDLSTSGPIIFMHVAAIVTVIMSGFSWIALAMCVAMYVVRMFAITGGYHRYFSHRSFKTSRAFQFVLGYLGACSAQMGPLWWATNHRHHHRYSDMEEDIHSPARNGIFWAHIGWILSDCYLKTDEKSVRDLYKYPELRFIDKYHYLVSISFAVFTFYLGKTLAFFWPELGTSGFQMLAWAFFLSTVFLYHGTFTINSLAHVIGSRRFNTKDDSKNHLGLALITLGEGWHNNHHRYPGSEKQGFYWWEIDITHYTLKFLSWFGIVWDLKVPPKSIYQEAEASADA